MKFPLSINKQLSIDGNRLGESTEPMLKRVEEGLGYLRMTVRRIEENELYFAHSGMIGSFSQKDYLQNMFVSIELESDTIKINLESNTTFLLIIGLLPLVVLFVPAQDIVPDWLWLLSFPTLIIGFALRISILNNIKKKLMDHLID